MNRLDAVLEKIDAFNRQDPEGKEQPYSEQLSHWVLKLNPQAGEALRIAARGQHIGRWTVPRASYPMDRAGYLRWREDLKRFHAKTVTTFMAEEGYPSEEQDKVRSMMLKKNLHLDADAQTLEDALCLVFLERQFEEFERKTPEDKMIDILRKSWRKMSEKGHAAALTLAFSPRQKELIGKALAG